jgi:2-polyprenyl-3-methyl-5-hydroxy-6-metoxy-1,4-benzoquinol methylase
MSLTLEHADGIVRVEELPNGRRLLAVTLRENEQFIRKSRWETSYPVGLIRLILDVKGPAWLCDEIMRDEDPWYVQRRLEIDLLGYFSAADFEGKQILDFGCGSGASTVILARMFPKSQITGVELFSDLLSVAQKRVEHYKLSNVKLQQSPSGTELPGEVRQYDFVILSAVYEHLLPHERRVIIPKLWSAIREGGYLFIDQTPSLLFPVELHTTGLPLINYLPARLALEAARRFSKRVARDATWEELLRQGIRGATEWEILRLLRRDYALPVMLKPTNHGLRDCIDMYYLVINSERLRTIKKMAKVWIKMIKFVFGVSLVPELSLAFQKLPKTPQITIELNR